MKRLRTLFASTAFATSLAITGPVSADLPVIDISNLKQSILTAANTLKEVNNQITQIQQFVQMLENEARNLLSLPFSALQQITSAIDQVNSLMRQAQSLAYDVARIDQQFQQLFPSYGGNVTQAKLISDARARWQASVDTFKHTMEVQSRIVSDIQADRGYALDLGRSEPGRGRRIAGNPVDQSAARASIAAAWQHPGLALCECSGAGHGDNASRRSRGSGARRMAAVLGRGVSYTPASVQVFGGAP